MHIGKVSVIVPVYNVEKYIDKCMESLLNQTYRNIEIILINDGSTDNSGKICDKYAEIDKRVLVYHKENGGVSSARNIGLDKVTGEYVTFVDPDDWVESNMYEVLANAFDENTDAVFCGYWEEPEKETGLTPILHQPEKSGLVNGEEALYQCLIGMGYGYFTAVWNKIFRTSALKKADITFEKYSIAEDELWLAKTVPLCNNVKLISTPFYHWRQSVGSALREERSYDRWYSALGAKSEAIKAMKNNPALFALSTAKVYNDIFDIVWKAYVNGDKKQSKVFLKKLKPYEKDFFKSKYFSKLKRIRFFVIKLMVVCSFPKKAVRAVGSMNGYRIKEKMHGV